jgi:DNA-binding GntR family transcriptional regulator
MSETTHADAFVRPITAQEAVLLEIRRMILNHEIAAGSPIRQDEIATRLGVSRVPVREALMMLEAGGQVRYAPHFGFTVPKLTADELVEVYLIREKLEELALRQSIERATDDDIRAMETALKASDEAIESGDLMVMTRANQAFHFAMLEPSRMPRLMRILANLWDSLAAYRPVSFMSASEREQIRLDHHEIFGAIQRRDVDQAIESLFRHRAGMVNALRRADEDGARYEPT